MDLAGLQYPERLNCASALLEGTIDLVGVDSICIRDPDSNNLTYGEVRRGADRIASALVKQYGIVPGNRVLLMGPNTPWLALCWLGILRAGAVVVTVLSVSRANELRQINDTARVNLSLCDDRYLPELRKADLPAKTVGFGSDISDLACAMSTQSDEARVCPTAADDVALLAFTSGTTGVPKATVHFHRDVLAIADTFSAHLLQPTPNDVFISTAPFAFTFGLGGGLVFPLRAGASSVVVERASPRQLADLITRESVSICFTAPTAYRTMLAEDCAGDLRQLRHAVSAGEHLPETTWQRMRETTGLKLIDGIGATEMLHVFISAAGDLIRPGSTGIPVPGYEAKIVNREGATVPPGTPGLLAVRGPTGCRYLKDMRQKDYVKAGWNLTGDIFIQDEEGYFWYQSRRDDMIVASGVNIAPAEIEEALLSHTGVAECAVVGEPDDLRGEIVVAYVAPRLGVELDEIALLSHARTHLSPFKVPRRIHILENLPHTPTGKLQRFRLRAYSAEQLG